MDRSEGRNDMGRQQVLWPRGERQEGRAGKEPTEEMEGMTVGGKCCCPTYGDDTARLQVTAELQSSFFTHLCLLFIILVHHPGHSLTILLDLDPSPNSAVDFDLSLALHQTQTQTPSTLLLMLQPISSRGPRW